MEREFFMKTKRIGFSEWEAEDIELAKLLWGDSEVTRGLSVPAGYFVRRK